MHWTTENSNYYNDHRVRAMNAQNVFRSIDLKKMTAEVVTDYDDDFNEIVETVKIQFIVCPTCNGAGKHTNPSIDCCGLTWDDFDQDPEFFQDYMDGTYDVPCYGCKGKNVVPAIDQNLTDPSIIKKLMQMEEEEYEFRRLQDAERRMGC